MIGDPVKTHWCPGHEGVWPCTTPEECRAPYEMLCDDCDTELVRHRLGGKWIE